MKQIPRSFPFHVSPRDRFKERLKKTNRSNSRSVIAPLSTMLIIFIIITFIGQFAAEPTNPEHEYELPEEVTSTPAPEVKEAPSLKGAVNILTVFLPKQTELKKEMENAAEEIDKIKKRMAETSYSSYTPEENAKALLDAMKAEDLLRIRYNAITNEVNKADSIIKEIRKKDIE